MAWANDRRSERSMEEDSTLHFASQMGSMDGIFMAPGVQGMGKVPKVRGQWEMYMMYNIYQQCGGLRFDRSK